MQRGRRWRGARARSTSVLNVKGVIPEPTSPSRVVECTLEHHLLPSPTPFAFPYLLLCFADILRTLSFVCLVVMMAMTQHLRFDSFLLDSNLEEVVAGTQRVLEAF